MNQFCWKWGTYVGRSGGILGGFRFSRFDIIQFSKGRYHVKVRVLDKKLKHHYHIVIVYGAAQMADMMVFLANLVIFVETRVYHF